MDGGQDSARRRNPDDDLNATFILHLPPGAKVRHGRKHTSFPGSRGAVRKAVGDSRAVREYAGEDKGGRQNAAAKRNHPCKTPAASWHFSRSVGLMQRRILIHELSVDC
jgi:hypothetical protein